MSAVSLKEWSNNGRFSSNTFTASLGLDVSLPERLAASVPFSLNDVTCGVENELQAVVIGPRSCVDLPRTIEGSNYYQNMIKRHRRGELPRKVITDLEYWLSENPSGVWENSWVQLDHDVLSPLAAGVLDHDLRRDKRDSRAGRRSDFHRFVFHNDEQKCLRIPVSYLLKLALVDIVGIQDKAPALVKKTGIKLAEHFLSDNTSPEVISFHVVPLSPEGGMGRAAAAETARRFLLTQLLVQYAVKRFRLDKSGQMVKVYFAPHPPIRQKALNSCISDSFYRELFMNPCLSGWDRGEDKHKYMHLCHQVLSRAQLNALARLKESGIINSNLMVLPVSSNISLLNNGTHISLGSRRLGQALSDPASGFGPEHEKYFGDLAIKFVEHFLPLFVGTYTAAPYRLDFKDFHPEKVLSFLPYQLDYTHLRMIWRRWKKKAHLCIWPLGLRLTPFGPEWVDGLLSRLLKLKGDYVPDFRLIDYLVGIMSTDQSPALDGRFGNQDRLKKDLSDMGVFDRQMPLYLPFRLREFQRNGYSGFEGRIYSLFGGFKKDMAPAADLQCLVTALAFQLIGTGRLTHHHIPDSPEVESERRQILFAAAIGLPTFYINLNSRNRFLHMILERVPGVRRSRRYSSFLRVPLESYRRFLAQWLGEEGRALIECLRLEDTVQELRRRLIHLENRSAAGRLTRAILEDARVANPVQMDGQAFNRAAEVYYRDKLRLEHIKEAWEIFEKDLSLVDSPGGVEPSAVRESLGWILDGSDPRGFLRTIVGRVLNEAASVEDLIRLIDLLLVTIHREMRKADEALGKAGKKGDDLYGIDDAPVYRQAQW